MSDLNIQSLHPGTRRPILDLETVEQLVRDYYGFRVVHVKELNGYDDKNFHVKVEKIDEDCCVEGYVLKIINVLDSENQDISDAQTSLLIHLGKNCIACSEKRFKIFGNIGKVFPIASICNFSKMYWHDQQILKSCNVVFFMKKKMVYYL